MDNATKWPAWARQNEAPIAVMGMFTRWHRPNGKTFATALYADGTVLRDPALPPVGCQTPEFVRQTIASIDFPSSGFERAEWMLALGMANARRDLRKLFPAPSRQKEDAHV